MIQGRSHPEDVIRGVRHEGQTVILELCGEIDMKSSVELKGKLTEIFRERPPMVVVNMARVKFMDSSGLATLVEALKWCRQNLSELRLAGLCERVRSTFEVCRLESVFQIYDNEAEALSQCTGWTLRRTGRQRQAALPGL